MKQQIYLGLAFLGLAWSVSAQPLPIWETPGGGYVVPSAAYPSTLPIDAVSFHNPQGLTFSVNSTALFDFSDCLNFTNQGYMYGSPGYDFSTKSLLDGQMARPAAWFVNQGGGPNGGIIDVSGYSFSIGSGAYFSLLLSGNGKVLINATNIINSGDIYMGSSSLIQLKGDNLDLSGGTILMTNRYQSYYFSDYFSITSAGILDNYWGTGLQPDGGNPYFDFGGYGAIPTSFPFHIATNRLFQSTYPFVQMANASAYAAQFSIDASNTLTQVVFLSNTNLAFSNSVYFSRSEIGVQWEWLTTNWPSMSLTTNYLFLTDTFGEQTNLAVRANGTVGTRNSYKPVNYTFYQMPGFGGTPATVITPADLMALNIPNEQQTNPYTAYQALFTTGTSLPTDIVGGDVTNMAGRIEITANEALDLTGSQISSLNYLLLKSPKQYLGNNGGQILAPNADLVLGSTNGSLALTNLMAPNLACPGGLVSLYSARLTNVDTTAGSTMTNRIHVLFVNSTITPTTAPLVHGLDLSAQNVVISDILNLSSNLNLHVQSLTLTTNLPESQTAAGQINILNPAILWPAATPGLQFMTNWGQFMSPNSIFFGGSRSQPSYDPSSINVPYQTFVNHGLVNAPGTYFWAKYFENTGIIDAGVGPVQLQLGFSVRLHDGAIYAPNSDISFTASDLIASNQVIFAGGALTLGVTNYLDDGSYLVNSADSVSNKNTWVANNGLSLPLLPHNASLLGTTVLSTNLTRHPAVIRWAGADLGATPNGFYNNAALGRLVLGGLDVKSSFVFMPVGANNALYVDSLEFFGSLATNTDTANNLVGMVIPANMKIYYGQALLNGIDYSRKLNGVNNGGFIWVSNFNTGFFSSSWVTYPTGTHRVNTAYRQDYEQHNGGTLPPIPADQTDTAPVNPAPAYPALVLEPGTWDNTPAGGDDTTNPSSNAGPTKLGLPASTRAGGPAGDFVAASYSGLFADTNGIGFASSGYFTVRTTPQGHYTGKVIYAGESYSFSGNLTRSTNVATASFTRGGLKVSFWLVSADAGQLQGQVTGPGWSAELVAFRQATTKSVPAAATLRGSYTLIIPPSTNGPAGYGFGTLKADAAGNVRWAGTLGDGTKVTQGSFFSSGGLWGLYASLYGGRGSALGWLQLSSGSGTNLSGQCLWVKPAGLGPRYYPKGFTNDVQALGSAYVRPHSGAVLPLNNGVGTLTFSGAGLSGEVAKSLTVDRHNRVTSSDSPAPSLKLNPATGLFSGSVWLPSLGKVSFQGAVFQNGNFAAGNFLGMTQSGEVFLSPAH
jgi:hypothetical protein